MFPEFLKTLLHYEHSSLLIPCWVEFSRDVEFWGLHPEDHVEASHGGDGDDDRKVGNETAHVGGKQALQN